MQDQFCEHVYKNTGSDICPLCGKDTHEIDWKLIAEQRRTHREIHGVLYNKAEWWSI